MQRSPASKRKIALTFWDGSNGPARGERQHGGSSTQHGRHVSVHAARKRELIFRREAAHHRLADRIGECLHEAFGRDIEFDREFSSQEQGLRHAKRGRRRR